MKVQRHAVPFVAPLLAFVALLLLSSPPASAASYRLDESPQDGRVFAVSSQVAVKGKVQTPAGEGQALSHPLTVAATYRYQERRLPGSGRDAEALRSTRDYEHATTEIDVNGHPTSIRLRDSLRLTVAQGKPEGVELYSPSSPLTYQELELLSSPADSLALLALLPDREVELDESWNPPSWVIQTLTRLEAVTKGELTCQLKAVDGRRARVEFKGAIEGADVGAATKVSVTGTLLYDLDRRCIAAASLTQSETRSVGAVSPGLEVVATVRLDRQPTTAPTRLTETWAAGLPLDAPPQSLLLVFESPWNISFLYDRDWHIFQQTQRVAFLRLLDRGSLVAQCNVSPVPSAPPGQHTSEQEFQEDIRRSLGNKLEAITQAEQLRTSDDRFLYRVTANGESNGVKMTWFYYLCAAPSGRQVAFVFAVQSDLVERVKNSDLSIVSGVRIGPAP